MDYIDYYPSPPLNTYIDDFYYVDGEAPYHHIKVFPMPSLHLMINLGDRFRVLEPEQTQAFATCTDSWSIGLWSTYHVVEWPTNIRFYGIHFKPAGAYPFLRLPLSELHNQVVSLDAIWGCDAAEIRERLYAAPSVQAGFALLEGLLLARLCDAPNGLSIVQYAISEIADQHGTLSIRALSNQIGISQSHLITHFNRMVGVSPKTLARFYRFGHVLNSIDLQGDVDWAQVAHQADFYDQSHFNKNFTAFTGYSPTDYLRLRQVLNATNPDQAENLGQMPID